MKNNNRITILIADDHEVVRMGLSARFNLEKDIRVIGEACNGRDAVNKVEELLPQIVVMDVMMPEMDGAEATKAILATHPETKILLLTTYGESQTVKNALKYGAAGALVKDTPIDAILTAIREVADGKSTLSPEIAAGLNVGSDDKLSITPRQREILQLVVKGFNNREIAEQLGISRDSVKFHLKDLFLRIGVASRSEAAAFAVDRGLVSV